MSDDQTAAMNEAARQAAIQRSDAHFSSLDRLKRLQISGELGDADEGTRRTTMAAYDRQAEEMRKQMADQAVAVYEDAVKRRGPQQAYLDQMQAAIGLPQEPVARQREIERRSAEGAAAMSSQSGGGQFMDILEGRVGVRDQQLDQLNGDPRLPEFNPAIRQGHGANIAQQTVAVQNLQAVAPGAPLTQANVADPYGAAERHEQRADVAPGVHVGAPAVQGFDWGDTRPRPAAAAPSEHVTGGFNWGNGQVGQVAQQPALQQGMGSMAVTGNTGNRYFSGGQLPNAFTEDGKNGPPLSGLTPHQIEARRRAAESE